LRDVHGAYFPGSYSFNCDCSIFKIIIIIIIEERADSKADYAQNKLKNLDSFAVLHIYRGKSHPYTAKIYYLMPCINYASYQHLFMVYN